jgi:hypothetical protein
MHSWRDDASELAQADLDALLNATLPIATQLLGAHGKFMPFAAAMTTDGEVASRAAYAGDRRRPRAGQVLDWLYQDARREAGMLRAVAFAGDMRSGKRDAIAIQLEHREGVAIVTLVPYVRSRYHRAAALGTMRASAGVSRVWTNEDTY